LRRRCCIPSLYEGFGLPPLEAWALLDACARQRPFRLLRESTDGRGELLPVGDAEAWADALRRALLGELTVPSPPPWRWSDAGRQLLEALA